MASDFRRSPDGGVTADGRIARFAHDNANWLAGALGHLELLAVELPELEGRHRYARLREILNACAEMNRELGGMSDEDSALRETDVDLSLLLRDAVADEHARRAKPLRIELDLPAGPHLVARVAALPLTAALANVLKNASEAIAVSGTVRVSLRSFESSIEIEIGDDGEGMDGDTLRSIFLPGFSTKGESAKGLGLVSARGTLRALDGDLSASSEVGVGSSFLMTIPASRLQSVAATETVVTDKTILLVEDDLAVAEVLEETAKLGGWPLHSVSTLAAAQQALDEQDWSVIVCDEGLPDGSGMALLKQIRQTQPSVVLVLLTGRHVEFPASGIIDRLALKPLDGNSFLRILQESSALHDERIAISKRNRA
jgi:two-component system CheB/CheR fusion protein